MKLEMISKYPLQSLHPTPLLFIHGTLHTASCWDEHLSITSLNMALRLMPSTCVDTAIVKDGKNFAGLELPILLKTLKTLLVNYPAHRF